MEDAKLIMLAIEQGQDPDERAKRKVAAKVVVRKLVRDNYRACIDWYMTLPKHIATAASLGAPTDFVHKYRQDPAMMLKAINYLHFNREKFVTAAGAQPSLAELRARAQKVGADSLFLRRNKDSRRALTKFINDCSFNEEEVWLY